MSEAELSYILSMPRQVVTTVVVASTYGRRLLLFQGPEGSTVVEIGLEASQDLLWKLNSASFRPPAGHWEFVSK